MWLPVNLPLPAECLGNLLAQGGLERNSEVLGSLR